MKYYFNKKTSGTFDDAVQRVTEGLSKEGFGVLTEIDVKATLKKKLGEDFYNYKILGACNPPYAHKALLEEDKIGTMLPCNVIVQERKPGKIEVSAINPLASMRSIKNKGIHDIAFEIASKLKKVVKEL
ncbi:MAG: DUF302 domain-containing protein [Bacteroidetes bacterium]|nr:DUF302 domain-containing protein [Bacteroidota bacterium]